MLILNCFYFGLVGFGTSKRLTHGTTTLSNAEEDYDRKTIDGKTYYVKPKSLYPDRDDGREKQPNEVGRTNLIAAGKFANYNDLSASFAPRFNFSNLNFD